MKQYLDLLKDVLDNGELITDGRTKEAYYSVFGRQVRYDLRAGFPLLTTKKMFTKGIIHELIWFLSGSTNVKYLQDNGVKIWDSWATKEQCAKFGREEGDLGPIYGQLWRKWVALGDAQIQEILENTSSVACNTEYMIRESNNYRAFTSRLREIDRDMFDIEDILNAGNKIDQIANVIEQIKTSPSSRRLIVTGWNPATCDKVALPPCHTLFQFKVSRGGTRLNCQLYQRSADAFLGVPFNIASYAILTHMIAQVCGLEVGEFIHTFGDLHIYENHLDQVKEQLEREPRKLSTLWLNETVKNIDDFKYEDIKIIDYVSHPAIKGDVAV